MEELSEEDVLEKLERKYERTQPGTCCVCGSGLTIDHKGGGLPLKWVCASAKAVNEATPGRMAHLEASAWMDYRVIGDARVMKLLSMYRSMKRKLETVERAECVVRETPKNSLVEQM